MVNEYKSSEELFKELREFNGYPKVLSDAALLCLMKAKDYQHDDQKKSLGLLDVDEYFPFGLKSYAHMINLKSKRIVSLANSNDQPENESIVDSALDLINYCAFLVMHLRKK